MNTSAMSRLRRLRNVSVLLIAFGLKPASAEVVITPDTPEIRQYLKACEEAVANYEKSHPDKVRLVLDRLKKIHRGLYQYMLGHKGVWPQAPENASRETLDQWWKTTLRPYGVADEDWGTSDIIFMPTFFDKTPLEAYHFRQPWVVCAVDRTISCSIFPNEEISKSPWNLPPPRSFQMRDNTPVVIPEEIKKAAAQ